MSDAVQDRFAPHNTCFGCGPSNDKGLRIKSIPSDGGGLICDWTPQAHHEAFPGMLNGGIIGSLLDCHCNWAAAFALMNDQNLDTTPCTVTADYHVKLKRPTPAPSEVELRAWVTELKAPRAIVKATLSANDRVCATCTGTFVAVGPEHPAYHRTL